MQPLKRFGVLLLFVACKVFAKSSKVTLVDNGYEGILIAINPEVPEDPQLIASIKTIWTDASQTLYNATKHRAYFREITILVPKTWSNVYDYATKETYNAADVIIAFPNPAYQDQPYTLQYGGCGEQGTYVHLTPSYVINSSFIEDFGPKGKAIVHEWGHYRWGVFDETYTYGYSPFYYDSKGNIEATRCPTSLEGQNKLVDYTTGVARDCQRNTQNGLPEDGCEFFPFEDNQPSDLRASLMSHQYVDHVEIFCHDDENDPTNRHNTDAPNEQNRLCNLRSTWEVILQSVDFSNGANPSNDSADTTPTFKVVRPASSRRYVLVLDTSGSMAGIRLGQMRQVVATFIQQYAATDDRVGIVEFESVATILAELISLQTQSDRNDLLNEIPTDANGGTCIGCGLETALEALRRNGESSSGGNIIVLTDGQENTNPMVNDIRDKVVQAGVIVHAVFFATSTNADLQQLVEDTEGYWYFGSDENINNILGAFKTLASRNDGDVYSDPFQVHSSTFVVDKYSTHSGDVSIDSTIGNNTVFTFAWSQYNIAISVVLESPSGCTYSTDAKQPGLCADASSPDIDIEFEVVTFTIPGIAKTGIWKYYVSTSSALSQVITATATSMASDPNIEPIVVTSGLDKTDASTGEAIVVYAQVSQGFSPVLGANVVAQVERPDGTVVKVELYDLGSAPDVRKDDGVYSRFFTGYNNPGRYAVQVTVSNNEGSNTTVGQAYNSASKATLKQGSITADGAVSVNPNAASYEDTTIEPAQEVGNFTRVVTNEGFEYSGITVDSTVDNFPPSKIIDLFAMQEDITDPFSNIILNFTAPGSNYDTGNASRYDLRFVINNSSKLIMDVESCEMILDGDLVQGNLSHPQPAGSPEMFVIPPLVYKESGQAVLGFSIRAFDASNNSADPSNVASVTYFFISPIATGTTAGMSTAIEISTSVEATSRPLLVTSETTLTSTTSGGKSSTRGTSKTTLTSTTSGGKSSTRGTSETTLTSTTSGEKSSTRGFIQWSTLLCLFVVMMSSQ